MATNSQKTPPPSRPNPQGPGQEHPSTHHDEVQEFLTSFKSLWDKWGNIVLTVILIALAAVLITRWLSGRAERIREAAYTELAETSTPTGKQEVAMRYDNVPGLAGKARLEAADILLNEALAPADPADPAATPAPRKEKLEQAANLYKRVIEIDHSPLQVIYARFGLAAVHESLGNFDAAREQYDAIQKLAADDFEYLATQAKQHALTLADISEPVTFPAPPPAPAPTTQTPAPVPTPQITPDAPTALPTPPGAAPPPPPATEAPAAPAPAPPPAPAPAPQN